MSRAREALAHVHSNRSLSAAFGVRLPYKKSMSVPPSKGPTDGQKSPICPRQTSAPPPFTRKKSGKGLGVLGGGVPEKFQALTGTTDTGSGKDLPADILQKDIEAQIQEENLLMSVIHGLGHSDPSECDSDDSMHMLITLLMQFLSRPDQSHPSEEKALQKNQQIVLRHLNVLLGELSIDSFQV